MSNVIATIINALGCAYAVSDGSYGLAVIFAAVFFFGLAEEMRGRK